MALIRKTDGSLPANIIKAAWWNDFMDLFTGAMSDQPVNVNNVINGNSIIAGFGSTQGIQIKNAVGTPVPILMIHDADTDTHLLSTATNHKLKITKDTYAYDIAVFDMSGSAGATTINGSLTVTGTFSPSALSVSGPLHLANNQYVDFKDTTGGNTNARLWCDASNRMVYKACTGNNHLFQNNAGTLIATIDASGLTTENNINIHAGQLNFTAGNNGAIRNPTGGELDLSAGGSAGVKFFTGNMATVLGVIDTTGLSVLSGGVISTGDVTITQGNLNVGSVSNPHQINFASGNNGAIRNPAGGALELTAGGSQSINFFTAGFGTGLGNLDSGGNLTINGTLQALAGDVKIGSVGNATALKFNAGNNGGIRNPSGGAIELSAGGSGYINFFTGNFATGLGTLDNGGNLSINGTLSTPTGDIKIGSAGNATALKFNAGNNGSITNPSGGVLGLASGGSAKVQFYTSAGSTAIGNADLNGFHLDRGSYNMLTGSISRISTIYSNSGASGSFNHNLGGGVTPDDCLVHLYSTSQGTTTVNGMTSTQVTINLSVAGLYWQATCWAH